MKLQTAKHTQLSDLVGKPLASGGEATIYEVPSQPTLVAKVYHQPTNEHSVKLAAMLAAPPSDPMATSGHVSIAWPVERIIAEGAGGTVVGYLMPRVEKARPIFEVYNPKARLQLCPQFHYGYLLRTAYNLATAVRAIHDRGYVIGDLNESNVLVTNQALVTVVDTDSFQVPDSAGVHRCRVGKPEYTAPELQRLHLADFDRGPEHDAFALAVLVFQLLMQGIHPYAGRYTGTGEPEGLGERIAAGHWPYAGRRRVPYAPSPHAPPLESLSPRLRELTAICFDEGHVRSSLRPGAADWQQALRQAEKELVTCPMSGQHLFHPSTPDCPWCQLARRQGRDPFPVGKQPITSIKRPSPSKPQATSIPLIDVVTAPQPLTPPVKPEPSGLGFKLFLWSCGLSAGAMVVAALLMLLFKTSF